MCRYMSNREHLMVAIDREKPLPASRSNDVLALGTAGDPGRAATASRTAGSTSGAWCSKRFTTRWCSGARGVEAP